MDTCKALNNSQPDQEKRAYLDNGSDTFGVGGSAWINESITDWKFDISGYDEEDTIKTDATIVSAVTVVNLPDGETIIICANEATLLGESVNSLLSEAQMAENGVHVQQTNDGRNYLDIDGYIIHFILKETIHKSI